MYAKLALYLRKALFFEERWAWVFIIHKAPELAGSDSG
jgi:hypothetical protein